MKVARSADLVFLDEAQDGCLDWLNPLSESHLRFILKSWIGHYNGGRPARR
jgi:hypothetical protein